MIEIGLSCGYCDLTVGTVIVDKAEDLLKIKDLLCRDCIKKDVRMTNYKEALDKYK